MLTYTFTGEIHAAILHYVRCTQFNALSVRKRFFVKFLVLIKDLDLIFPQGGELNVDLLELWRFVLKQIFLVLCW